MRMDKIFEYATRLHVLQHSAISFSMCQDRSARSAFPAQGHRPFIGAVFALIFSSLEDTPIPIFALFRQIAHSFLEKRSNMYDRIIITHWSA